MIETDEGFRIAKQFKYFKLMIKVFCLRKQRHSLVPKIICDSMDERLNMLVNSYV
jgi:hypothetical protein